MVAFKALVLNGDERVLHVLGDLVDADERAVLYAVELRELHPLPARFILIVDCRALLERVGRNIDVQIERRMHVDHEDGEKHQAGGQADGENGADDRFRRTGLFLLVCLMRGVLGVLSSGRLVCCAVFFHKAPPPLR